ncbi:MAG: hypothetical protein JXR59_07890 [Desulfuromonadaceae bacterium]|nr:hypothetical protein [Desulfuromonadaceae bacterium]
MKVPVKKAVCLVLVTLSLLCALRVNAAQKPVAVFLSKEIAPYVLMLEGLEKKLQQHPVERFFLDQNNQPYSLTAASVGFRPDAYAAAVAVGPLALRYLAPYSQQIPVLYGMILDPERILDPGVYKACGVGLGLSVERQMQTLQQGLPGLSRLGVFYDPANNQSWFDSATQVAASLGIELVPFEVQRVGGKLDVSGDWKRVDALLFIPDKTIISKTVIQYVIKQALLQHKPVIGYNQFFLDSGAAFSFIFDYVGIGAQAAALTEELLATGACSKIEPVFELRENADVWKILNLPSAGGGL